MARTAGSFLEHIRHRRALAGWQQRADRVAGIGPDRLDRLRGRAVELRRQIDRFVWAADARLEQAPPPPDAPPLPPGTDWVWRPEPWVGRMPQPGRASVATATGLGAALHLFHDCPHDEIGIRQQRNPGWPGLPPFALDLEVFGFEGSFLSLVIDLPEAAVRGLGPRHLLRLEGWAESERPLDLYARLNLCQGPNAERILRQVPLERGESRVEFDLGTCRLHDGPIDKAWLDLILDAPRMNRVTLRDLRLSRLPRAGI